MAEVKAPKATPKKEKKDLYAILSAPIPEKYLVTYTESGKEFTGYHAQYAIDLLNETAGLGSWGTAETILKEEMIGKSWFVSMVMELTILTEKKGKEAEIVVTGYGAGYAKRGVNSYKSAKTSAFKNACRYLGIGKELYIKGFEDDIVEVEKEKPVEEAPVEGETQALINKINEAQSKSDLEVMRKTVNKYKAGESVKKIILTKFNEKLNSFG